MIHPFKAPTNLTTEPVNAVLPPVRQDPADVIEISDDESGTATTNAPAQRAQPVAKPVSDSYYTLKGLPLAPAGPGIPLPVVYPVHMDALTAALKSRAKFFWVVVRGRTPGVYDNA